MSDDHSPRDSAPVPELPAGFSPTIALVALARGLEVRVAGILEPHALTVRKYRILSRVAATPGIATPELTRHSGASAEGTRASVRQLTESGYVRAVTEHRRDAAQLTLTDAGSRVIALVDAELRRIDTEAFTEDADMRALAVALADASAEPYREPQD